MAGECDFTLVLVEGSQGVLARQRFPRQARYSWKSWPGHTAKVTFLPVSPPRVAQLISSDSCKTTGCQDLGVFRCYNTWQTKPYTLHGSP